MHPTESVTAPSPQHGVYNNYTMVQLLEVAYSMRLITAGQ